MGRHQDGSASIVAFTVIFMTFVPLRIFRALGFFFLVELPPFVLSAPTLSLGIAPRFPVMGHIHLVVPPVAHKVDRSPAGMIFLAVLAPFFLVPGRNVQVERLSPRVGVGLLSSDFPRPCPRTG